MWALFAALALWAPTPVGLVEGVREEEVAVFWGIPYAEARRFAPPEPLPLRPGAYTQPGPACPQKPGLLQRLGGWLPPQEENCLNLNLFLPLDPPPPGGWPVLVFLHGGSFASGSGAEPLYHGRRLAQAGALVVTLNYRLGPLGFLPWEGAANLGLLDMVAALGWLQRHIAYFGGDPGRVALFGESAGGAAVCALLASPRARGLFGAAILQSPALGCEAARPLAQDLPLGRKVAQELGCQDPDCLRRLPLPALLPATTPSPTLRRLYALEYPDSPFRPHLDGEVLPLSPLEALRQGQARGIPLVFGYNAQEVDGYYANQAPSAWEGLEARLRRVYQARAQEVLAYYRARFPSPRAAYGAWQSERLFLCPVMRALEAQAPHGPVYLYRLAFRSPDLPDLGSFHGLDLPVLFGNLQEWPARALFLSGEAVEQAQALGARMRRYWVNLAQRGEPLGWPRWPDWGEGQGALLLDWPLGLVDHPFPGICRFL